MSSRSERHSMLLLAARQSPDFALRALAELAPQARAELLRRWSLTLPQAPAAPVRAPRLRKCSAGAPGATALGAQLQAFARTVRRVG